MPSNGWTGSSIKCVSVLQSDTAVREPVVVTLETGTDASANVNSASIKTGVKKVVIVKRKAVVAKNPNPSNGGVTGQVSNMTAGQMTSCGASKMVTRDGDEKKLHCDSVDGIIESDGDGGVLKKPRRAVSCSHGDGRPVSKEVASGGGGSTTEVGCVKRIENGGVVMRSDSGRVENDGVVMRSDSGRMENDGGDEKVEPHLASRNHDASGGIVKKAVRVKRKVAQASTGIQVEQGASPTRSAMAVLPAKKPSQQVHYLEVVPKDDEKSVKEEGATLEPVDVVSQERKKSLAEIKAEM